MKLARRVAALVACVGSSVPGTVVSIPVNEGQTVKAGQLLVALDSTEAAC